MNGKYVMGLDIGTTSVKACIFDLKGKLVAEGEKILQTFYPQQGWAEQDPREVERSSIQAVREAVEKADIRKDELISIGFSAAMHSLVCVDIEGNPLSPALLWADGRGYPQAERILKTLGNNVYVKTGTPVHPMTPFVKLLWMKENNYDPYKKAAYFMSIKEYILYSWFNERVIDFSMASATGLFNPTTLRWEQDLLSIAGISEEQLSAIVPPTNVLTGIHREIAEDMGIREDMPFVIGAADGQLANLGIGAILPGEVAVSVGTSGAIRQITKGVKLSKNQETFCYSFTEETTIIGGPTNNGGIALQWLKNLLNDQGSFEEFLKGAETAVPGADGLIFLPYINGERAPLWNPRAKGNFYGVTVTHKKEHFIRAVLEGITFNLYQIGQELEQLAGKPQKIYVNGGLSRSPLWLQMMADIFETEIYVPESYHSAAWGAAWVSLVAVGEVHSFEEIKKNVPMSPPVLPNRNNSKLYKQVYKQYTSLAKDLMKYF